MKNTVTGRQQGIKAIVTIGSQNQEVEERKRMARLTDKDEQGNWMLKGVPWEKLREGQQITKEMREKLYGALWKLMEYEDTGLTPAQIREIDKLYLALCRELTELRKRQQWIPVDERLPENLGEMVLVQVSGKPISNVTLCDAFQMAQYDIEEGWIIEEYPEWEDAKPIAWMPLPEPYKAE